MTAEYPGAIWMPVPVADLFTTNTHQAVVIHKTASPGATTPQEIAQYFINSSPGPSVHYIIGLDGSIVQCAPEALGAGGNCCLEDGHDPFWDQFGRVNLNTVTLSIEHVDPTSDNSTPCPQAQITASFALVLHLCQKYAIPWDHIKPHSSLDPISRARCPGNYPFNNLLNFVQKGGNLTDYVLLSAEDTWNAATGWSGKPPSMQTNIWQAYLTEYRAGRNHGVPLFGWTSHDYNGNTIAVMEFTNGRAEDTNGSVRFIY